MIVILFVYMVGMVAMAFIHKDGEYLTAAMIGLVAIVAYMAGRIDGENNA